MPKIIDFHISNFKGIEALRIDLANRNNSPVITLVGLNESGKTTILEAISHFVSVDEQVSSIFTGVHAKSDPSTLIPIHRRGNFTANIVISSRFEWEESDRLAASDLFGAAGYELSLEKLGNHFVVERSYGFTDSELDGTNNLWSLNLYVRKKPEKRRKSKEAPFEEYQRPQIITDDLWFKTVQMLARKLPKIMYFPTFLVDIPSRIYLNPSKEESAVNVYYRKVIQEILSQIDSTLSVDTHIIKRIKEYRDSQKDPAWWSLFFGTPTKRNIDSVIQRLSASITKEVIGSWSAVFQRPSGAKSVQIEWNVDTQKDDAPYISFYVSDGESRYLVSERSLGFRWFFSFLLFTAFKEGQARPTLFLFDEPAANLHAKAQAELLKNFGRIASGENRVIYSTHSHHMIDPRWLASAYIVENKSIDYDSSESLELNSRPTQVVATTYRSFVSQYPARSSYFQPIIEKLDYVAPGVIGSSPFVLLEGITDYYAFTIVSRKNSHEFQGISLIPGSGAGSSSTLLSYLIGRGERFIVVLDDDVPGHRARQAYQDGFYLDNNSVATIGDLVPEFSGKKLESLLSDETKNNIKLSIQSKKAPTKKEIGFYLAERCAANDFSAISAGTEDMILKILRKAKILLSA